MKFIRWSLLFIVPLHALCQGFTPVEHLRTFQLDLMEESVVGTSPYTQTMLLHQAQFLQEFTPYEHPFDTALRYNESVELLGKFYYHINKGDYFYYTQDTLNVKARAEYLYAIELAESQNAPQLVCEGIKKLLTLNRLSYLNNNYFSAPTYLSKYKEYAYDDLEIAYWQYYSLLFTYRNRLAKDRWNDELERVLQDYVQTSESHFLSAQILNLFANYYFNVLGRFDDALSFNNQALERLKKIDHGYKSSLEKKIYTGLIRHHVFQGNKDIKRNGDNSKVKTAQRLLSQMDTTIHTKVDKFYKRYYYFYLSAIDTTFGRYQEGYSHFREYTKLSEQAARYDNVGAIQFLDAKYRDEYQKAEIKEQSEVILSQQKVLWIISAMVILFAILTVALIFAIRNIRQKNLKIETLMRELHHRVKNNLQIISSLLGLQSMKLEDASAIKAVNEGKGRIRAMSLIHQKLYQTDEVTSLDIREYLSSLIAELVSAYGFHGRLDLQIEVPSKSLDADRTLPIGLIINELVSNTFKYAFADVEKPRLRVGMNDVGGQYHLIIEDNGPGLPDTFDLKKAESFGLKLVNLLVKQMKGSLQYSSGENVSRFQIEFGLDSNG